MKKQLSQSIAVLTPGCFAIVMATGIVSIAEHLLGMSAIAWALFALNIMFYAVLVVLTIARACLHARQMIADLGDSVRGPGFFTWVAGTSVLGRQFLFMRNDTTVATALWLLAIALWLALIYAFFTAMVVREEKAAFERSLNGAWLLIVVATQSVSLLGTSLCETLVAWRQELLFTTLCLFLLGGMLYIIIATLVLYRWLFFKLEAEALTPPYWINMGAVAITTLAGSTLIMRAPDWWLLQELLPFLKGFTLFFWSTASWWIPLLLIMGVWRHGKRRVPLTYDPSYWGMVFPLGMYSVGTLQLGAALRMEFLAPISQLFVHVALCAWAAVFLGMMRQLARSLRRN